MTSTVIKGSLLVKNKLICDTIENSSGSDITSSGNCLYSVVPTCSFDNLTRTLTVALVGATPFKVNIRGYEYTKYINETYVIPAATGLYLIYYNALGVLASYVDPTPDIINGVLNLYLFVAYVYWDNTNSKQIYFTGDNKLSTEYMSKSTRKHLHHINRIKLYPNTTTQNAALTGLTLDDTGANDSHAKFDVRGSKIYDCDIITTREIMQVGLPIYYRSGANAWVRDEIGTGFSFKVAGSGRMAYNQYTGGVWQQTEMTDTYFSAIHIFTSNDLTYSYFVIQGQNQYATKAAVTGTYATSVFTEIYNIKTSLESDKFPIKDCLHLYTLIAETQTAYTNSVNTRLVTFIDSRQYIDWRLSNTHNTYDVPSFNFHSNMSGLTQDDHTQYATLANRTGETLNIDDIVVTAPYSNDLNGGTIRTLVVSDTGALGYDSGSLIEMKTDIINNPDVSWAYDLPIINFRYKKRLIDVDTGEKTTGFSKNAFSTTEKAKTRDFGWIATDMESKYSDLCFYDNVRKHNNNCKVHRKNKSVKDALCTCKYIKELRGIHYNKMIPVLLKLIQDQKKLIDKLTFRVEKIEK